MREAAGRQRGHSIAPPSGPLRIRSGCARSSERLPNVDARGLQYRRPRAKRQPSASDSSSLTSASGMPSARPAAASSRPAIAMSARLKANRIAGLMLLSFLVGQRIYAVG